MCLIAIRPPLLFRSLFQTRRATTNTCTTPQKRSMTTTPKPPPTTTTSSSSAGNPPTTTTTTTTHQKNYQYERTSHLFQPRYVGPDPNNLTEEQSTIRQSIIRTRPHTGISGPFGPWLSIPSIASPAEQLGRVCRYGMPSLSFRESELIILLTGARHSSHAEFDIHYNEAIRAGIDKSVIHSIPRDEDFSVEAVMDRVVPSLLAEEGEGDGDDTDVNNNIKTKNKNKNKNKNKTDERNDDDNMNDLEKRKQREIEIVKFTAELLETSTVKDDTYDRAKDVIGGGRDEVLVEITSIVGYYTFAAYTLNVFRIPTTKPKPSPP